MAEMNRKHLEQDNPVGIQGKTRVCHKCSKWNHIDWWWQDEASGRWVCYSCGMGRREEQDKIEAKWEKEYGTNTATPPSTR